MVIPEIKSLLGVDLEHEGLPLDPEDCAFAVEAGIGPKGEEGEELFQFMVVTPKFLVREAEAGQGTARWGRGYLITPRFSWEEVECFLEKLLSHCQRETWSEVAYELGKEMNWEFENYQG